MPLLWSLILMMNPPPPVETGGYKYCAPLEHGAERPWYPDLSLGRDYYKFKTKVEIVNACMLQGTSGAPIINSSGKVVGLVAAAYLGTFTVLGIALAPLATIIQSSISKISDG
jgi:hypothetical protein